MSRVSDVQELSYVRFTSQRQGVEDRSSDQDTGCADRQRFDHSPSGDDVYPEPVATNGVDHLDGCRRPAFL